MAKSNKNKSCRGFAALSPERRRAIASLGGRAAHAKRVAYTFTPEAASASGMKGGRAVQAKGVGHGFTSEDAREAGRKGGLARWKDRTATAMPRPSSRKPGETRGRPVDEGRRAAAVRLRAAGLTLAEIGERLGVTRQAVQQRLARAAGAEE